jgi:hypothetical protein
MHACVSVIARIRDYNCCILINISRYNNAAVGTMIAVDYGYIQPLARIHPGTQLLVMDISKCRATGSCQVMCSFVLLVVDARLTWTMWLDLLLDSLMLT